MKRRDLIKSMGLLGGAALIPSMLGGRGLIANANATGISQRQLINARAFVLGEIDYVKPTVMPQVINIFLYGGPSELGGNLSNIREINEGSPNKYSNNIVNTTTGDFGGFVTPNHFWGGGNGGAGGEVMEDMIAKGRLTVLRTLNRQFDDSRAHRPSIFSNLTGLTGAEDDRPGIATNLASILSANNVISEDAVFPFVTFEGDSVVFNRSDILTRQNLKPISLDRNLNNPYRRTTNNVLGDEQGEILEALAQTVATGGNSLYDKVNQAFAKRKEIEVFIIDLKDKVDNGVLPDDPDFVPTEEVLSRALNYPNDNFGQRLQAAVNLMIGNPDTAFISLGSGGLGGWDDHDSAQDDYPPKLRSLMNALNVAAKHLEAVGKSNVMINVYGDFGRNVHLNGSMGWDHGNNQNLFTVSANPNASNNVTGRIEGYELGKIIGRTENYFEGNVRQYTRPLENSYQAAPFAVASTIYKYFGIQNPEIITDDISPIDFVTPVNEWIDPSTMV